MDTTPGQKKSSDEREHMLTVVVGCVTRSLDDHGQRTSLFWSSEVIAQEHALLVQMANEAGLTVLVDDIGTAHIGDFAAVPAITIIGVGGAAAGSQFLAFVDALLADYAPCPVSYAQNVHHQLESTSVTGLPRA